jgi:hypothetical protein
MIKKYISGIFAAIGLLIACNPNDYLAELYVPATAAFDVPKTEYDVFESVVFTNRGSGQYYVVYPGDKNHRYGQTGNTGFSTNSNGTFRYSYSDPGTYTAVWVASSVNAKGEKEISLDSLQVTVIARDGGLDRFAIYNIFRLDEYLTGGLNIFYTSYGEFISPDTILCPILFSSWRDATINSIKAKQLINFELSSNNAKMYWVNQDVETEIVSMSTASRIVTFVENGKLQIRNFRVKTASGIASDYYVAPVMIPQFTRFTLLGVDGTITRSTSDFSLYDVTLELPAGTDLQALKPEFAVMNSDADLLDANNCIVTLNGVPQTSGNSVVDFSGKQVEYHINYTMLNAGNSKLTQQATVRVKITLK